MIWYCVFFRLRPIILHHGHVFSPKKGCFWAGLFAHNIRAFTMRGITHLGIFWIDSAGIINMGGVRFIFPPSLAGSF